MTWLSKKLRKWTGKKEKSVKFTSEIDLPAVFDFLTRSEANIRELRKLVRTLKELQKEHQILHHDKKHDNMRKQILVFDQLMYDYQFFEDEADINGSRLKGLREDFLHKAQLHHKKLYEKFKDEPRWNTDW